MIRYTHDIATLIKFVDSEHVSKVLSGNLKMGSVKKFREEYNEQEGLRNDPDEFISASFVTSRKNDIIIRYKDQPVGRVYSRLKDRLSLDQRSYLFCISAITGRLFGQSNSWCFDSQVKGLGSKSIIVTNLREFIRRVRLAVQVKNFLKAYPGTGGKASGLVQYIDFDKYNGPIGPFIKSKKYNFQNEWRLALIDSRDEVENYPDHLFLEVGDLTDIAFALDTDELIKREFSLD